MRFAILTDIHLGPEGHYQDVIRKISKDVKLFLDEFIQEINAKEKPDFLIVLGDLIEDDTPKNDKANITFIVKKLKEIKCPVYYVAGNHDLKGLSEKELTALLSHPKLFYSYDAKGYHFIVLFSKRTQDEITIIPKKQVQWLESDLEKTKKKCVVFVHHGLAEQNLKGNPWFEGRPNACLIHNRDEVRRILEKSGKVLAVFNSHLHWDKKHVHETIPYFTIQSFVENEGNKSIPSKAFAIIDIEPNKILVEVKGNYPKKFSHEFKRN